MKKKKIIISAAILSVLAILMIIAYCFYQRYVTIYEPVTVRITRITTEDAYNIDINGITPLNRKIDFQYSEENDWNIKYTFLKAIHLFIHDTLIQRVKTIEVNVNQKNFLVTVKDLKTAGNPVGKNEYLFPSRIHSEDSFVKKVLSIFRWDSVITILKLLLLLSIILVLTFFVNKLLKKRNTSNPKARKIFIWIKIIVFSVLFACALFFGFLFFAYTLSTYITSLLFMILTGLLFWLFIKIIVKRFKKSGIYLKRTRIAILVFLTIWFCIETFLRIEGTNANYNELQKLYYISGFHKRYKKSDSQNPDLLVNPKYHSYIDSRKEFSFEIKSNNEGLRDIDHSVEKPKDEFRIICIGNSFTEGIGTPQDSTWPKLLEDRLRLASKKKVAVFNVGIAGSDPFSGYMLFEKRMLKYNPDIVLIAISSSDFNFYRFRGGFERFTPDGYHFREGPWWEKLYAVSYICRFITDDMMHYKYFFTPEEYKNDSVKAMNDINDCIHRFYKLSLKHNFTFAVVYFDDGDYKLDPVLNSLKQEKIIPVIDLVEYNRKIEKLTFDGRKAYYWQLDGHCNSRGYYLFAKGVEWNLMNMGIIDSLKIK